MQLVELLRLYAREDVLWFSIPNEGFRSPRYGKRLKDMGMKPGAADLIFLIDRIFHAVELKILKGTQIETQKNFETNVVRAGGVYHLARGFDEALDVLVDIGAFRPGFNRREGRVVA